MLLTSKPQARSFRIKICQKITDDSNVFHKTLKISTTCHYFSKNKLITKGRSKTDLQNYRKPKPAEDPHKTRKCSKRQRKEENVLKNGNKRLFEKVSLTGKFSKWVG